MAQAPNSKYPDQNQKNKTNNKSRAVNEMGGKPNMGLYMYTRTANESDASLLIANSTGKYTKTPDFTAISNIDPRHLGIDEYSEYIAETRAAFKFSSDSKGNIHLVDVQLLENNPIKTEEIYGKRLFNNNEKGVNGTEDLRVYSNNASTNINGTNFSRIVNLPNFNTRNKFFASGEMSFSAEPKQKLNIMVNVDDLTRDYNIISDTHRDFITNSVEGRPVEIDKKISEIFTFYTREQYQAYTQVEKSNNPNFIPFEPQSLPSGISFYEANEVTKEFSKYFVMDSKLFQSTGDKIVDKDNFIRNYGSSQLEELKEFANRKLELYQKHKETFLANNPNLNVNNSNIMEVKRINMYISESIQNDGGFIKACSELEAKFVEKLNPALKQEVETKLQELENVNNHKDSSAMKFDLTERLEKMELNERYINTLNEWTNFQPIPTAKAVNDNTKDGKLNVDNATKATFESMGLNDYSKIRQMSREELIIRWDKLNTQMNTLIPASNTGTAIDSEKAIEIQNTSKAMSLLKDIILTHPDNQKAFEVNPYSTGNIDKIPVDITTYYALKKLQSIEALDKNRIFDEITPEILASREKCESLQKKLIENTENFGFNINKTEFNYKKLMEDDLITKEIADLAIKTKILTADEIQKEILDLTNRIQKNNENAMREVESEGDTKKINEVFQPLKAKQEILENAIRNELVDKIISTHVHAHDYSLDVEKHMQFIIMNDKTRIAEEMQKSHEAILNIYTAANPTLSKNPVLHDMAVSEIKSFLATKCNLTNAEMNELSSNGRDFFKTNDFYQLIHNPRQGQVYTFENLTELTDLKRDLQDPIKCKEADEKLTKELAKLTGVGQDNDTYKINNDGRRSLIEEYQAFLREHISENKQAEYLERKQMAQGDENVHYKANYPERDEAKLLKSINVSNELKHDSRNPYIIIQELNNLKSNGYENTREYSYLKNAIENPSVKFNMNENVEILHLAQNREGLINLIVDKYADKEVSTKEIMKAIEEFKTQTTVDFSKDKEFIKELSESRFEDYKMLKNFKEFYQSHSDSSMDEIKDKFLETIDKNSKKNEYQTLFKDNELVNEFVRTNETNVVGNIIEKADNPLYCKAKLDELTSCDPLGIKDSVVADIEKYMDKQTMIVRDAIIEQSTKQNVETAPALDIEIFKQTVKNNGIEARTLVVQDLVIKETEINNGKTVDVYRINSEQRDYCDNRLHKLEANFALDEDISSIEKRISISSRGLTKEQSATIFEDNFGSLQGIGNTRAEHLAIVTDSLRDDISSLNKAYKEMQIHGVTPSENTSLYKQNVDVSEKIDKSLIDTISSEKNINAQIIEVDRAIEVNSYSLKYPDKDKLYERMIKLDDKISENEVYLDKLKEENYEGRFSLSQLHRNIKNYFSNKGNQSLSDNNNEILSVSNELEDLRTKYAQAKTDYENSNSAITILKEELRQDNHQIASEYKNACELLGINEGFINKICHEQSIRKTNNNDIENKMPTISNELQSNLIKLGRNEMTFMDLPNSDISTIRDLINTVREDKLNDQYVSQQDKINILKINIAQDIAESVSSCREKNEYILLTEYKEGLKNVLTDKQKITDEEYSQVINVNCGYSHTTESESIKKLNDLYSDCKQTFENVSNCRRLLQNLDESLITSGKTNSENIFNAMSELDAAINLHNKSVMEANKKFESDETLKYSINSEILSEAGISHSIREKILADYNDKTIEIHYGQEIFKEYMNKIELNSTLIEMKSEELRQHIEVYEKAEKNYEAYNEKMGKVLYGENVLEKNDRDGMDGPPNSNENSNERTLKPLDPMEKV